MSTLDEMLGARMKADAMSDTARLSGLEKRLAEEMRRRIAGTLAMTEKEEAIKLANKVLDEPGRDPDSDLPMLARQLLRALERLGEYTPPVRL